MRRTCGLILAAAFALGGYGATFLYLRPAVWCANPDFEGFYRAGTMVIAGDGARVYDLAAQRAWDRQLAASVLRPGQRMVTLPFLFAPFTLLLFAPLARLPYSCAEAAWYALNLAILLALPFLLRSPLKLTNRTVAAALVMPALFLPVVLALMQGQMSILLLLLFALVFVALARRHDGCAGALLALAAFKPQFVLAALVAVLAARRFKPLWTFLLATLALFAASAAELGWSAVCSFPAAIAEFERAPAIPEHAELMPNLRGMATALAHGHSTPWSAALVILASVTLLAAVFAIFRRDWERDLPLRFAFLLAVTVLTSYHCYLHDASMLLLAGLLTSAHIAGKPWTANRAALAATMAASFLIPLTPSLAAMSISFAAGSIVFAGLLCIELKQQGGLEPDSENRSVFRKGRLSEIVSRLQNRT